MKWLRRTISSLLPEDFKKTLKKIHGNLLVSKEYYSPMTFKYYKFVIYWLRCYIISGLNARQVFYLGLGSSFVSKENILKYSALQKVVGIYEKLSPIPARKILRKKDFYIFCKHLELPIPKLYAIISKNHDSFSYINSSPIKNNDLVQFIRNQLPSEFVIKPNSGEGGWGLNICTKSSKGIIDGYGNLKTEQEIIEDIYSYKKSKTDSFIVQERLRNHPYLLNIQPSEYLHSIRIITLIDSSGQFKILDAHLNVARGQERTSQRPKIGSNATDLRISISLNDGSLEFGILVDNSKGGFKKITKHPDTEQNFNDFKLPFWEEVLLLLKKASLEFLPLRTLGWDIAIAEKGIMFLEANCNYGPPYLFMSMDKFVNILTEKT